MSAPVESDGSETACQTAATTQSTMATKSTSASRTVASLTAEQLARKRRNDRQAQRAIRERTKSQIQQLQDRIRELEQSRPHVLVQEAQLERDQVIAENGRIRTQLRQVMPIFQSVLESAEAGLRTTSPSSTPELAQPLLYHSTPKALGYRRELNRPANPSESYSSLTTCTRADRPGIEFLLDDRQKTAARLGLGNWPFPASVRLNMGPLGAPSIPATPSNPSYVPAYSILPKYSDPADDAEVFLLEFLREKHEQAAAGLPESLVIGASWPNIDQFVSSDLLACLVQRYSIILPSQAQPTPGMTAPIHPFSKTMVDIILSYSSNATIVEQLACTYIIFGFYRWLVYPTAENYNALPEWLRPRPSQIFRPHPVWIDFLPWPALRDDLLRMPDLSSLGAFFAPYPMQLNLNWTKSYEECLMPAPHLMSSKRPSNSDANPPIRLGSSSGLSGVNLRDGLLPPPVPETVPRGSTSPEKDMLDIYHGFRIGDWVLTPAFKDHIYNVSNWRLGQIMYTHFPHLRNLV